MGRPKATAEDASDEPVDGPVCLAYLRDLEALGEAHSGAGQAVLTLARQLDSGAGMASAAIHKEIRATMKELTPHDGGDDFTQLMASLSAEVRDSSQA